MEKSKSQRLVITSTKKDAPTASLNPYIDVSLVEVFLQSASFHVAMVNWKPRLDNIVMITIMLVQMAVVIVVKLKMVINASN